MEVISIHMELEEGEGWGRWSSRNRRPRHGIFIVVIITLSGTELPVESKSPHHRFVEGDGFSFVRKAERKQNQKSSAAYSGLYMRHAES